MLQVQGRPGRQSIRGKGGKNEALLQGRLWTSSGRHNKPAHVELTPARCSGSAALSSRTRSRCEAGQTVAAGGSIQNEVSRSLISQDFLPKGDTNRRFRRTLRHKRFFGASDTTADQRAGGTFIFEEENRATFSPQRRGASAKVVLACAQK